MAVGYSVSNSTMYMCHLEYRLVIHTLKQRETLQVVDSYIGFSHVIGCMNC